MASVAKLKDKARDFERKEDWAKAVDAYLQVIKATEKGDGETELSLYNRVGDIYLRLGKPSDAVDYYSKAADHYGEAGLYNNAIALCNKALRYQPDRLDLYRKLGKLSAEQGFTTDARRWYLEYAEKLAKQGRKDQAFEALKEFASLSEDPEIREMLAAQLHQRGETEEAVTQLRLAWTHYRQQNAQAQADAVRKRILSLDPGLEGTDLSLSADGAALARGSDLPGYAEAPAGAGAVPEAPPLPGLDEPEPLPGFDSPEPLPGLDEPEPLPGLDEPEPLPGLDSPPTAEDVETTSLAGLETTEFSTDDEVLAADLPALELESTSLVDEEETAGSFDLPALDEEPSASPDPLAGLDGFEGLELATADEDDAGLDLPTLDAGLGAAEAEEEAEEAELPTFDLPTLEDEARDEEAAELPTFDVEPGPIDAGLPALADEEEEGVSALPSLDDLSLDEAEEPGTAGAATIDEWGDFPGETGGVSDLVESGAGLVEEEEEEEEVAAPVEPEPEPEPVAARGEALDVDELIRSARARFDAGETREALASLEAQHANLADANRVADAYRVAEALVAMDPNALTSHQARVEYAFRLDDKARLVSSYLDFAACLRRTGAESKAESVYNRVLELDPRNEAAHAALAKPEKKKAAAGADEFIDLGGLLMEDEEETTRFVVAETVESGDEERDFAEMLSTFRAKIAQHVPQEDTDSHYDLGIAFKEMGLVDEAISEFQVALRGGNERLKVYEELGQCFMQKQQFNIAAQLLARGAQLPAKDDAELLGVYYLLGRCYEELGQKNEAKAAYERVLGLDIDFRDVNERLAHL